jgi:hypothetical protein
VGYNVCTKLPRSPSKNTSKNTAARKKEKDAQPEWMTIHDEQIPILILALDLFKGDESR